jgi:hypothetical protein
MYNIIHDTYNIVCDIIHDVIIYIIYDVFYIINDINSRMVRDTLLFGWSENFSHQGPEHGHIDNCKKLANCTNNKEAYLEVLLAHSREGHLQYLRSLEADLADAEQDKGEVAADSVAASAVDKDCDAIACELGIQCPTLQ